MFHTEGLNELYRNHRTTFEMAGRVADALKMRFHDMDEAIDCLMIAAISGEAMVMIGPPGTAKSRLVRAFSNALGLISDERVQAEARENGGEERNDAYFEYLLTQFTEPSELFGFIDIPKLMKGDPARIDKGMMQKAQVVFLDEVFNASSAILNALLTFMNERRFHDRGEAIETPLRLLVSATNHRPQESGLEAVYDRFLLRVWMHNTAHEGVQQADLTNLLSAAWNETHAPMTQHDEDWSGLLDAFAAYRADVDSMTLNKALSIDPANPALPALTSLVSRMVKLELSDMSNRRLVKMTGLVLAMRMLRSARAGERRIEIRPSDLDVILKFSLDRDEPSAVEKIRQELELD